MNKPKAVFCWSGGKDSALALYTVLTQGSYDVAYLLTTVNDALERVSMHGVCELLLERQAASIGIPLLTARVTDSTYEGYERQMSDALLRVKDEGIDTVIYGDIFLEDLRLYRERFLEKLGMQAVFPLWQQPTDQLIDQFVTTGFRTILCCTNDAWLGQEWVGAEIDSTFRQRLPVGVDPCGENGEYHSFCYAGPLFRESIDVRRGEVVYKPVEWHSDTTDKPVTSGFWYIDLLPA